MLFLWSQSFLGHMRHTCRKGQGAISTLKRTHHHATPAEEAAQKFHGLTLIGTHRLFDHGSRVVKLSGSCTRLNPVPNSLIILMHENLFKDEETPQWHLTQRFSHKLSAWLYYALEVAISKKRCNGREPLSFTRIKVFLFFGSTAL